MMDESLKLQRTATNSDIHINDATRIRQRYVAGISCQLETLLRLRGKPDVPYRMYSNKAKCWFKKHIKYETVKHVKYELHGKTDYVLLKELVRWSEDVTGIIQRYQSKKKKKARLRNNLDLNHLN